MEKGQKKCMAFRMAAYGFLYGSVWQFVRLGMAFCTALYGTLYGSVWHFVQLSRFLCKHPNSWIFQL